MTRKTDNLLLKTLAFLLAVAAITMTLAGGTVSIVLAVMGRGDTGEAELQQAFLSDSIHGDMGMIIQIYAQEHFGQVPVTELNRYLTGDAYYYGENGEASKYPGIYTGQSNLRYEIFDSAGRKVAGNYRGEKTFLTEVSDFLPGYLAQRTFTWDEIPRKNGETAPTVSQEVDPVTGTVEKPADPADYTEYEAFLDSTAIQSSREDEKGITYTYWANLDQKYTVKAYLLEDLPFENDSYARTAAQIHLLYESKTPALWGAVGGLILSILLLVYLFSAAGRRTGEPGIHKNLMDRLPLDLYAGIVGMVIFFLFFLGFNIVEDCLYTWIYAGSQVYHGGVSVTYAFWGTALLTAVGVALVLGFFLSLATRCKLGRGYWWKQSIVGFCLRKLWHFIRWCGRAARAVVFMLPVIWRWLGLGFGLWLVLFVCTLNFHWDGFAQWMFLLASLACAACLTFAAWSVGKLREKARRMAAGDFAKGNDRHMHGIFREISADLDALGQGAERAVEEKMKSERLKTELITNVSHDIKTPLTSIVNYVDLLQKPHTEEQEREYLAVLDRQSKRMKKLTEDLVEMSKASTGNIPTVLAPTNLTELSNQALGEYGEKIKKAGLTPALTLIGKNGKVLEQDARIMAMADGRLLWRVLDNLLGNAVKYAQPGTRVYLDIEETEKKVMLSVKNISRERLNISAEELMERFVRGDASRNTEGSGLGLNIARSLTELQKARLNLIIDGDLFKAIVVYDVCQPEELREELPEEEPVD